MIVVVEVGGGVHLHSVCADWRCCGAAAVQVGVSVLVLGLTSTVFISSYLSKVQQRAAKEGDTVAPPAARDAWGL